MKPGHVKALSLAGLAVLGLVQVSCSRGEERAEIIRAEAIKSFVTGPNRVVTISYSGGTAGPCEVDFPVTLLRMSKHTIAWYALDHDYWVYFDNGSPISGTKTIYVKQSTPVAYSPAPLPSGINEQYYTYAIYDFQPPVNPSPSAACKSSTDDHDTGVNVKR